MVAGGGGRDGGRAEGGCRRADTALGSAHDYDTSRRVAPSPGRRGRRGLPVSGAGSGRAQCRAGEAFPETGRRGRPARHHLAEAAGGERPFGADPGAQPVGAAPGVAGPPSRRVGALAHAPRGGGPGGEGLSSALRRGSGAHRRPDRAPIGEGVQGARPDAGPDERGRGGALAQDRRRRVPPQRGLSKTRRSPRSAPCTPLPSEGVVHACSHATSPSRSACTSES
jgi:hypothetical protein